MKANEFGMGTTLMALMLSMMKSNGPSFGRRFLCGQARCTEIGQDSDGRVVFIDRSEVRNALANKYLPHQGKKEIERRLRQMRRNG